MSIKQIILFISLAVSHSTFCQRDTTSFPIIFDSLKINIAHAKNYISSTNIFYDSSIMLVVDYHREQGRLVLKKNKLTVSEGKGQQLDSVKTEKFDISQGKEYSFHWQDERIQLNMTIDSEVVRTKMSIDDVQNVFDLEYFFRNDTIVLISYEDQSRRFKDTADKYDDKIIDFVTTIGDIHNAGIRSYGYGWYWVNDYLLKLHDNTVKKIRGKKVRITGVVTFIPGVNKPNSGILLSAQGRIILGQGFGINTKRIYSPHIKVLKNRDQRE